MKSLIVTILVMLLGSWANACVDLNGTFKAIDSSWGEYSIQFEQTNCERLRAVWMTADGHLMNSIDVSTDGQWRREEIDIGYILKSNSLTDSSLIDLREYHEFNNQIRTSRSEWRLETHDDLILIGTGTDANGNSFETLTVHYKRN